MSNNQLPAEVLERINNEADKFSYMGVFGGKPLRNDDKLNGYIAGATAEAEMAQKQIRNLLDVLEKIVHAPVPANEREYMAWFVTAKNIARGAISEYEVDIEMQQWKERKDQSNAKEGIIRIILAGAYDVSKDAQSAEEYLKAEGVNVAEIKANAQYFTWKTELIKITKEKTGESVVKINDAEAVKWYNDGFTPEQTFREAWQSDGD